MFLDVNFQIQGTSGAGEALCFLVFPVLEIESGLQGR